MRPVDLSDFRKKKEHSVAQAWDAQNKKWKKEDLEKKDVEFTFVSVNIEVLVKYDFNPPTTSLCFPRCRQHYRQFF